MLSVEIFDGGVVSMFEGMVMILMILWMIVFFIVIGFNYWSWIYGVMLVGMEGVIMVFVFGVLCIGGYNNDWNGFMLFNDVEVDVVVMYVW